MRRNGNLPWTPERIRSMRGDLSRADFAERVGVSALTVYRWELPDGAPEARRPRGKIAERLAELVEPAPEPAERRGPGGPEAEPAELRELLPIGERLLHGELARVEADLLVLLGSGRLRTAAGRAFATALLSRYQLWTRGDSVGAYGTLLPALHQAAEGALPASIELEVHVTAALVFASNDGRIFDPGKVSAHATRAERLLSPSSDAQRFLLWNAQLIAAYILNDPPVIEVMLERRDTISRDRPERILRCLSVEATLILHYFARRPQAMALEFQKLLELTATLPVFHVRALAQALRNMVDEAASPAAALAVADELHARSREAGIAVGLHDLFAAYAEGDALYRAGRLAEAERCWLEGLRFSDELRWSFGTLPFFLVRHYLLAGRASEIRSLVERVERVPVALYAPITRILCQCLALIADAIEGRDGAEVAERFDALVHRLDDQNVWSFLRRSMVLANAVVGIFAGTPEQADHALRHAERVLDEVPARWALGAVRGLRGAAELRRGNHAVARSVLEESLGALEGAGDRVSSALVRHWLSLIATDLREDGATERLDASTRELADLGLVLPPVLTHRAKPRPERTAPGDDGLGGALAIAVQRLTGRGATEVTRELVAAARQLFPGAAIALHELDERGGPRSIHRDDGATGGEVVVFGDGAGRRFQLAVRATPWTEAHARCLAALAGVAGLALEAAALRGVASRPEPARGEPDAPVLPGFIASSAPMRRLKQDLARLARSRATIVITGESGAGKEVVARALHDLSVRANRAYVAFNCAAIPRDLFEGQLFGYRKGAFTGATADHAGVIRAADGGTIFLDEIGELPLEVQPKLLRFLENAEIFPLGEQKPVRVDVRVIAATFRDLEQLVREGRFREDLYYRLQVVPIHVPPLRERPEDIVALARFFIGKLAPADRDPPVLAPSALAALTGYAWPGNVRELRNVIERSLAFDPLPAVLEASHLRIR